MLISIAVDYRHANVATRERFHLSDARIAEFYAAPRDEVTREMAILATCNRTELYAWCASDTRADTERTVQRLARRWMKTASGARELLGTARRREGERAALHLIRVAAGLESQVIGDGQILGQLRSSYRKASQGGVAGPVLHRLFDTALRTGKRVQTETSLSAGRNSIGAEAAAVAAHRFGTLSNARIVVLGSGKTGERVARQLIKLGARDLVMINRTYERARELASSVGGRAALYEQLHCEVAMADVMIAATSAETPLLDARELSRCRDNCGATEWPLLMIDLAVPRNVDPEAATLPGVSIVDLDQLHPPIVAAEAARRAAVPSAEQIVSDEIRAFTDWMGAARAREAIRLLRATLADVCRREVAFAAGEEVARRTSERIVAKVLSRPMTALRTALQRGESVGDLALALDVLFAEPGFGTTASPTTRSERRAQLPGARA